MEIEDKEFIVLVGPSGCGKSTTLYTFLRYLAKEDTNIMTVEDPVENEIVGIAASLEHNSSHPIAQAIVNYATMNDIEFSEIEDFKNVPGKGILANINGEQFYAANESLIEGSSFEISRDEINRDIDDVKQEAKKEQEVNE